MRARNCSVLYPWLRRGIAPGLPVATLLLATALVATPCKAGDAAEVPAQAIACFGCHGVQGRSLGAVPDLAGMSEDRFSQRMKAFREGAGTAMRYIAPAYTEAEVARMAAYFASLEPAP